MCYMNIVIVIDSWSDGNGAVIATKRVGLELIARGHKISIVCTGKHNGDFKVLSGSRVLSSIYEGIIKENEFSFRKREKIRFSRSI